MRPRGRWPVRAGGGLPGPGGVPECGLNRGVPAPEVAQRAGHSVDVLLKVYAKCIEGDRVKINNNVVEDAFAE